MPTAAAERTDRSAFALRGRLFRLGVIAAVFVPSVLWITAKPAHASKQQMAMFEDDVQLQRNPPATLDTFRSLGVGIVRVYVNWGDVAPRPKSKRRPSGFKAADPRAYPPSGWAIYDEIVRDAVVRGVQVDLTVTSPAPLWSDGPGAPRINLYDEWKPSPTEYGAFVRAIGTRYSGHYTPPGATSPLPRVSFWALWNEPNFGKDLSPQATNGSRVPAAAMLYRGLLDAGWNGLRVSGHRHDTILIGSLAARGENAKPSRRFPQGLPDTYGETKPLQFIRTLYCIDSRYRQLRGTAARAVNCPTNAPGSRGFRRAHPGLFAATGFADHPYPVNLPPTLASAKDPDYTEFSELPQLGTVLDRVQRAYGSTRRLPIYVTEYGYITNPPNHTNQFVSPPVAAYYINWAEYLSWRNPRIATTMQYLLQDPNPRGNVPEFGGFASGLEFYGGAHKPGYDAYRLPLYLPVTTATRGSRLEVWGCARPAHYGVIGNGQPQSVQIQFRSGSSGGFYTIRKVPISDPNGYFDVRIPFPASGTVRLAYTYPVLSGGATVFSRAQKVTTVG